MHHARNRRAAPADGRDMTILLLARGELVALARCPCGATARARWPHAWARCDRCGVRVVLRPATGSA